MKTRRPQPSAICRPAQHECVTAQHCASCRWPVHTCTSAFCQAPHNPSAQYCTTVCGSTAGASSGRHADAPVLLISLCLLAGPLSLSWRGPPDGPHPAVLHSRWAPGISHRGPAYPPSPSLPRMSFSRSSEELSVAALPATALGAFLNMLCRRWRWRGSGSAAAFLPAGAAAQQHANCAASRTAASRTQGSTCLEVPRCISLWSVLQDRWAAASG